MNLTESDSINKDIHDELKSTKSRYYDQCKLTNKYDSLFFNYFFNEIDSNSHTKNSNTRTKKDTKTTTQKNNRNRNAKD